MSLLTKLYNSCLDNGAYPWSSSIITPLHKKGSQEDPDNYRAIAVSSVIGKLFATILLERLITFRKKSCPDPPNQLGFTKNAQTYDHILTMKTVISKYKKLKKKTYAVFVDFRKAFDSVCRQALFYKLSSNGVIGKFYNILRDMYSNSSAQIKLCGHLSDKFPIKKGTEQGHPLSPDLFKLFLSDLSPLLEFKSCPILSGILISHLLWADDLILLALDPDTLQKQLDRLTQFCRQWGIEINMNKTKLIIFGDDNKNNCDQPSFTLNNKTLVSSDSYCYLGIVLHKSGKISFAIENLNNKALRALLSLKRTVNRSKLSFRALSTLFDSLIKPIILYGAPIWTHTLPLIKNIASSFKNTPPSSNNFCSKISRMKCENIHLNFLKWALGTHRKASNIGTWGETGRYPLIYQSIKLTLNYFKRVENLKDDSLVYAAFQEQEKLNLPWFRNIEPILRIDDTYDKDHVSAAENLNLNHNKKTKHDTKISNFLIHNGFARIPKHLKCNFQFNETSGLRLAKPIASKSFESTKIYNCLLDHFKLCWSYEKSISSKLSFYHLIKTDFNREVYLQDITNSVTRHRLTKLRISAHDLAIEKGRYKNVPRDDRVCNWCVLTIRLRLIEDENHILYNCDLYSANREKLCNTIRRSKTKFDDNEVTGKMDFMELLSHNKHNIKEQHQYSSNDTQSYHLHEQRHIRKSIANFVSNCFDRRYRFENDKDNFISGFQKLNAISKPQ